MKLTLYIDWLQDKDPYEKIRSTEMEVTLPNSDFFHVFEAWINLSRLEDYYDNRCADKMMDNVYDIVLDACNESLGLTEKMYRDGVFDIDDPIADDKNNGSAIITIYVPKR